MLKRGLVLVLIWSNMYNVGYMNMVFKYLVRYFFITVKLSYSLHTYFYTYVYTFSEENSQQY